MKIGIFAGATSVRSKNIFTEISLYSTGKHEINSYLLHGRNPKRKAENAGHQNFIPFSTVVNNFLSPMSFEHGILFSSNMFYSFSSNIFYSLSSNIFYSLNDKDVLQTL